MNQPRDIERLLDHWFADGSSVAPDRVIDVVADRIERQPQRPAWRLDWRHLTMNTTYKIAAAIAAIAIVGLIGYSLLPGGSTGVGGPGPTASPSVTPPASGSPTSTPVPTGPPSTSPTSTAVGIRDVPDSGGDLDPGKWRFRPFEADSSLSAVAEVPAGWLAYGQGGMENMTATNSPPSGIAIFFEMPAHGIFSDPCHWDVNGSGSAEQDGDVAVGPKVSDLVGALRANTAVTSSTPTPVAFGSSSGQQLGLRFPADLDPAACDRDPRNDSGTFRIMPDTIYSQGKANIWEMSIVDVGGKRVVVIIEHFPGTAPDKLAEATAIVKSLQFTP